MCHGNTESLPFDLVTKPTFRQLFLPFCAEANKIEKVGREYIHEVISQLGPIVKEATKLTIMGEGEYGHVNVITGWDQMESAIQTPLSTSSIVNVIGTMDTTENIDILGEKL